jgi:hypothetical protein
MKREGNSARPRERPRRERAQIVTERPPALRPLGSITHDRLVTCLAAIVRGYEQQFDGLYKELSATFPPEEVGERLIVQWLATYGL